MPVVQRKAVGTRVAVEVPESAPPQKLLRRSSVVWDCSEHLPECQIRSIEFAHNRTYLLLSHPMALPYQ